MDIIENTLSSTCKTTIESSSAEFEPKKTSIEKIKNSREHCSCRSLKQFGKDTSKKKAKKSEDIIRSTKNIFKCKICDKFFIEGRNLKYHISNVHEGQKDYQCDLYQKKFATKQSVERYKSKLHIF